MPELDALYWPLSRLGEALPALARRSGLEPRPIELPAPPEPATNGRTTLGRWIEDASDWLGIEAETSEVLYPQVEDLVRTAGPAILLSSDPGGLRFLAVVGQQRGRVVVLAPDLSVQRIEPETIRAALCQRVEAPLVADVNRIITRAGIPARRQGCARSAILSQQLSNKRIGGCWRLRPSPGASFWGQMRLVGLPRRLAALVGAHTLQYVLWLLSWWMIGKGALQGRLDTGWLLGWALLLITLVPLRLCVTWWQGLFAIGTGGLLKQRLLYGVLRLKPDEIRHQGSGQLLGRVLEAEAVESLALTGGFLGLVAVVELVLAAVVLNFGAGGWLHLLALLVWIGLTLLIGRRYSQRRKNWTHSRLEMTHDLVERMVGHRTRLAQQPPEHWHDGEDQALEGYIDLSRNLDRSSAQLVALVPRGWIVVGLLGLAPAFVSGSASPVALAIAVGGMLLAFRAFERLAAGVSHLAGAAIAWEQVAPFFHAAAPTEKIGAPALALAATSRDQMADNGRVVMEAGNLVFRYRDRGEPVLRGCNLQIRRGDRILLEGPSGGGKSTLAALLVGLREPESGLLLLDGLDRQTLGPTGWRRRVVAAPQYHENHILTGTFAFNLLMSRRWPPQPEDMTEAEALCRELGLGELLDRIPAGMLQMVGETGWQLSQGERSRLYIARALLQEAELIVLDESFAALDPETLNRALRCVLDRASTLIVIAHP